MCRSQTVADRIRRSDAQYKLPRNVHKAGNKRRCPTQSCRVFFPCFKWNLKLTHPTRLRCKNTLYALYTWCTTYTYHWYPCTISRHVQQWRMPLPIVEFRSYDLSVKFQRFSTIENSFQPWKVRVRHARQPVPKLRSTTHKWRSVKIWNYTITQLMYLLLLLFIIYVHNFKQNHEI